MYKTRKVIQQERKNEENKTQKLKKHIKPTNIAKQDKNKQIKVW